MIELFKKLVVVTLSAVTIVTGINVYGSVKDTSVIIELYSSSENTNNIEDFPSVLNERELELYNNVRDNMVNTGNKSIMSEQLKNFEMIRNMLDEEVYLLVETNGQLEDEVQDELFNLEYEVLSSTNITIESNKSTISALLSKRDALIPYELDVDLIDLSELEDDIANLEGKVNTINAIGSSDSLKTLVSPVSAGYSITSTYGSRVHPISGKISFHNALDLRSPSNTELVAILDGVITFSGYNGAYGNHIVIDHGQGVETTYSHLNTSMVKPGDLVSQGDIIGLSGNTGTLQDHTCISGC